MNYRELKRQYKDYLSTFRKYLNFDTKDIDNFETLHFSSQYIKNKKIAYSDSNKYFPYIKEAKKVLNNIKEIVKNKTLILITHMPSDLEIVDRIIVMDSGKVMLDDVKSKVIEQLSKGGK